MAFKGLPNADEPSLLSVVVVVVVVAVTVLVVDVVVVVVVVDVKSCFILISQIVV